MQCPTHSRGHDPEAYHSGIWFQELLLQDCQHNKCGEMPVRGLSSI